jgi:hypothetical protein
MRRGKLTTADAKLHLRPQHLLPSLLQNNDLAETIRNTIDEQLITQVTPLTYLQPL